MNESIKFFVYEIVYSFEINQIVVAIKKLLEINKHNLLFKRTLFSFININDGNQKKHHLEIDLLR